MVVCVLVYLNALIFFSYIFVIFNKTITNKKIVSKIQLNFQFFKQHKIQREKKIERNIVRFMLCFLLVTRGFFIFCILPECLYIWCYFILHFTTSITLIFKCTRYHLWNGFTVDPPKFMEYFKDFSSILRCMAYVPN